MRKLYITTDEKTATEPAKFLRILDENDLVSMLANVDSDIYILLQALTDIL